MFLANDLPLKNGNILFRMFFSVHEVTDLKLLYDREMGK